MLKEYYVLVRKEGYEIEGDELAIYIDEGIYFDKKDDCINYMDAHEGELHIFKIRCEILLDINAEKLESEIKINTLIQGHIVPEIYYVYTQDFLTHMDDSNELALLELKINEGIYFSEKADCLKYRNAQSTNLSKVLKIQCIEPLPLTETQLKNGVILSKVQKKEEVKVSNAWKGEIILSDPIRAEIISIFDTPKVLVTDIPQKQQKQRGLSFLMSRAKSPIWAPIPVRPGQNASISEKHKKTVTHVQELLAIIKSFSFLAEKAGRNYPSTAKVIDTIDNQINKNVIDYGEALAILINHFYQAAAESDVSSDNKENNIYRQIIGIHQLAQYDDLLEQYRLKPIPVRLQVLSSTEIIDHFELLSNKNKKYEKSYQFIEKLQNELSRKIIREEPALVMLIDHMHQCAKSELESGETQVTKNIYQVIIDQYNLTQYDKLLRKYSFEPFKDQKSEVDSSPSALTP